MDYLNPEAQLLVLQEPDFHQQALQGQQLRDQQDQQWQLQEHQLLVLQEPDFHHQQALEDQELWDPPELQHLFHNLYPYHVYP